MIDISTMHFLVDLSVENSKQWFDDHRSEYEKAKENFLEFIQNVIDELGKYDKTIKDVKAKDCLFRINRDVRFSKNKSPYKTHFGASICLDGRKSMKHAGYYFHLEPDNAFLGGGLYGPEPETLAKVRQTISGDLSGFKKTVTASKFKSAYGDLKRDDEYSLKRVPKGYEATDPAAEYLKLKGYVGMTKMDDKIILSKDAVKMTVETFRALQPLIEYLNNVVK